MFLMKPAYGKDTCVSIHEVAQGETIENRGIQRTEGSIPANPIGLVHPLGGPVHKVPDLVHRTLSASVEILAGEFGNPDGATTGVVIEVLDVGLEVFKPDVVPMDADDVRLDADLVKPALDPSQTVRCRSGSGGAKDLVAL